MLVVDNRIVDISVRTYVDKFNAKINVSKTIHLIIKSSQYCNILDIITDNIGKTYI